MSCEGNLKLLDKARERAVWIALGANIGVAIVKFISAYFSGSRVVVSEGLHSMADSVNSILLLIGLWSARKPPDDAHPYGYGKDAYFWTLMAAVFMLGVISTGSIALGYERILNPSDILDVRVAIVGLLIAMAAESVAVYFAISALLAGATVMLKRPARIGDLGRALRETDNPTAKLVFVEDAMALTSATIALVFVLLVGYSGSSRFDGIGAIVIGIMLGVLAFIIGMENRDKLIGEAASDIITKEIERAAMNYPPVRGIAELKTMVIGPNQLLVNITVEMDPDLEVEEMDDITAELERTICRSVPQVRELFIEVIADEDDMGTYNARRKEKGRERENEMEKDRQKERQKENGKKEKKERGTGNRRPDTEN